MKKIIKYTCYTFLAVFFAVVLIRIFMLESSNVLSELVSTDGAKAAYATGETMLTNEILQSISEDGFSRVYSFVYIPSANEIQLTVKYNMSIYDIESISSDEIFAFKLYETEGGAEFSPSYEEKETKGLYAYSRLVFENVSFSEEAALELVICSADGDDEYSVFTFRQPNQEFVSYKPTKNEKALLEG